MLYKVGDRVKVVDKWPENGSANQNSSGAMDKYLGTVHEIVYVGSGYYRFEDNDWYWYPSSIEKIAGVELSVDISRLR